MQQQSQEGSIISEFLRSLGPWRDFIIIGGGFALFIYKQYFADPKLKNNPVGTRDIDSLIPRRVPEISRKSIAKHLQEAGFTLIFKDMDIPATESYIKQIDGVEVEIEFLTDSATRKDKNKNVMIAGSGCSTIELFDFESANDFGIPNSFIGNRKGGLSRSMDIP